MKMLPICEAKDLQRFSKIYGRSGMIQNGIYFQLRPSELRTSGKGAGLLPTPSASDFRDRGSTLHPAIQRRMRLGKQIMLSMLFRKNTCPYCVEGMMGFPREWTRIN